MCRRNLSVLWLIVLVMSTSSCFLNPDVEDPVVPPPDKGEILPLTTREAVLNNLEVTYNKRQEPPYQELLDDGFTFFFSTGDVGGNIPEQWGRADELIAAGHLFDKSGTNPNFPLCRSIRMDLKFEDGVQWVSVIPEAYPTETWYMSTVYYSFNIEVEPDITYIAVVGSQAQFTVRNTGTEAAPAWKLVEWRDLANK